MKINHIQFGKIKLLAINTPGHSPDSISILLEHDGKHKAVFTGDTLFIGDCGRPDLREAAGKIQSSRQQLAGQMYHSLRNKLMPLNDDVAVYPAHGAGTLCGKSLSEANSSTIGEEKKTNWSLQPQTEDEFVKELLHEQPFVPGYFAFDVELNRKGAKGFEESVQAVTIGTQVLNEDDAKHLDKQLWVVDVRNSEDYKNGHLPHSVNLMEKGKFETWLGTIILPGEKFYLAASGDEELKKAIERSASIGYEIQIAEAFVLKYGALKEEKLNPSEFKRHLDDYTIIDVRNPSEVKQKKNIW